LSRVLIHVADRVLNRPLLIHPLKAEIIVMAIRDRIGVEVDDATVVADLEAAEAARPSMNEFIGTRRRKGRDWAMTPAHNGVAIITIAGSLVNRGAWIGNSSGLVSYEGIGAQLRDAANDPEVHAILLDIESYGGEASGNNSLAALIRSIREDKPVTALVNDVAASGGYGIAAAANEIVVSPTSMVGSVGVVMMHLDVSGEMEKKGQVATLIYAGKHKVDGHPFGPLPDTVKADLQAEVSSIYDEFVNSVAAGRGFRMASGAIRATEARTYYGQDAIDHRMADRMGSFDDIVAEMSQSPRQGNRPTPTRRNAMANASTEDSILRTDHERIMTGAAATARAEGRTEGEKAGATAGAIAERARIKGITSHPEAAGRATSALSLAMDTDMSVEAAGKVLATIPKTAVIGAIAERAAGTAEFGDTSRTGALAAVPEAAAISGAWARRIEKRNKANGGNKAA
jgi:signal peptide peptidase SppA